MRVLAEEGGRTSRGSLGNMQDYVAFLNQLNVEGLADAASVEAWWVERIRDFFSAKPFALRYDTSKSMRAIVRDLLGQASKRQKDNPGTMYAGAVLQHLVGAKLTIRMVCLEDPPPGVLKHPATSSKRTSARWIFAPSPSNLVRL